ncbi:hypothetical protein AVEN_246641-1 [Araneus ventricosus]|uniref:Uncharacterized protein n=1 Tax=Araneus ventricosus TaxID=182803 RepID=A0A4Y2JSV9_ARAVE|nr:hypothetical protein AVEN_246641-1 [Araneus ventricosus]
MKHDLDIQVAKFFYSCNIPFNVAEQAEFLALIQKLRPGYKPQSLKALSENLLNEVTTLLQNDMALALENKECTLMEGGWSNIHNKPVIASCLHTDGKSYFLNAEECGRNKKQQSIAKCLQKNQLNWLRRSIKQK